MHSLFMNFCDLPAAVHPTFTVGNMPSVCVFEIVLNHYAFLRFHIYGQMQLCSVVYRNYSNAYTRIQPAKDKI